MYAGTHVCAGMSTRVYVEASNTTHLVFETGSLWNPLTRVGCLASEPRGSSCLCLLSVGIIGTLFRTQLLIWVLGEK